MNMNARNVLFRLVTFSIAWYHVTSFFNYLHLIPNGKNVKHPCIDKFTWKGVGHQSHTGGGPRNRFGEDFAANDHKWTRELCRKDSDGDGKTNGEELGDPECVWEKDVGPTRITYITHPGVCDPVDSEVCKRLNDWDFCKEPEFKCDSLNTTENLRVLTLQQSNISLPNTRTSYICEIFELPADKDYHLVAFEVVRDNTRMLHHVDMYGCGDDLDQPPPGERVVCTMTPWTCTTTIGGWTVGLMGMCHPPEYGILVGKNSYRRVAVQTHFNNPSLRPDQYDASIIRLYITDHLRPNDATVITVLTNRFTIPPRQPEYPVYAVCPGLCSYVFLKDDIKIATLWSHAHYTAIAMKTEIYRLGRKVRDVVSNDHFMYDNPIRHDFDPPVVVHPGDEIVVSCTFDTMTRNMSAQFGPSTYDEMCLINAVIYPIRSFRYDLSLSARGICRTQCMNQVLGCPYDDILNGQDPHIPAQISERVLKFCSPDKCLPYCAVNLEQLKTSYPCLALPWMSLMLIEATAGHIFPNTTNFFSALRSCDTT